MSIPNETVLAGLERATEDVVLIRADDGRQAVDYLQSFEHVRANCRRAVSTLRAAVVQYHAETKQLADARDSAVRMSEHHLHEKLKAQGELEDTLKRLERMVAKLALQ